MAKTVKQKEINFLTVLVGKKSKKGVNPRALIFPGVLLLIIGIGAGVFAMLHLATTQVESDSNVIREYLNSPDVTRERSQAEALANQAQAMKEQADAAAAPLENIASYPDLSSADYLTILELSGANIQLDAMRYDRATGILSFTATSDYVLSIPTFISQLRSSGIFTNVNYSGYAGNVSPSSQLTQTTNRGNAGGAGTGGAVDYMNAYSSLPSYAFSVECSVKPPDPKPLIQEPEETEGEEEPVESEEN